MLSRKRINQSRRLIENIASIHHPNRYQDWPSLQSTSKYYSTQSQPILSSSSLTSSSSSSSSDLNSESFQRLLPVRPSTSKNPKPSSRVRYDRSQLGAAALLSRSPLLLRSLSEFESAYYEYQRQLNRVLSKPIRPSFFFRPGSQAAKTFELSIHSPTSLQLPPRSTPEDLVDSNPNHQSTDFQNLERAPQNSIYLLVKLLNPNKQQAHWQLPTSKLLAKDTLTKASLRAVHTSLGPNMDIWSVGKVPATVYTPQSSDLGAFEKVWVMPQRILRGRPILLTNSDKDINNQTSSSPSMDLTTTTKNDATKGPETDQDPLQIDDFAWFTSDEIHDRVEPNLWKALEPILK